MYDEELARYLAKGWRVRIIKCYQHRHSITSVLIYLSVWRPEIPVGQAPLAVCDNQTLRASDLLETDQVNSKYQGEIYFVKFNERQRFYYLSNQQRGMGHG